MSKNATRNQKKTKKTGGGAATHSGTDYQNRVAAWIVVNILAENKTTLQWNLPVHTFFESFRCETDQAIDDIFILTSDKGVIYIQAKHTISLEKDDKSEFASVINQFVKQFIDCRYRPNSSPWDRPINPYLDRFVLATGTDSSSLIRVHLISALNRLRTLTINQPLENAAVNKQEAHSLEVIKNHVQTAWMKYTGVGPTNDELRQLLTLIWTTTLEVDDDGFTETESKNVLKNNILENRNDVENAWNLLITICAGFAKNRSGGDRIFIVNELLRAGIGVNASSNYEKDIEQLKQYTIRTIRQLVELSVISINKVVIKVERDSTHALIEAAEKGSVVVIGEPGSGKSGALHDVVINLRSRQRDIVYIAVDKLEARSLSGLKNELGTSHDILEILDNWPGQDPAYVIIDALDAARSEYSNRTFQDLLSGIISTSSRWRVLASIRKYDLRYSSRYQRIFAGKPPTIYYDSSLLDVCHINVPTIDKNEFIQIAQQSQTLADFVLNSSEGLKALLHNFFNLKLMAELLYGNSTLVELLLISNQNELLDKYWLERVIKDDIKGDAREIVLKKIVNKMVESRSLTVNRDIAIDTSDHSILHDLLSSTVISEWQANVNCLPDRYTLTFTHHVLYDYAVSRLILRQADTSFKLPEILAKDSELVLAIRPSIVLHFKHLWITYPTRQPFWELVCEIINNDTIPVIGKIIGPSVSSEMAKKIEDYSPILDILDDSINPLHMAAEKACIYTIGAISSSYDLKNKLVGNRAGPWAQYIERLSRSLTLKTANIICPLLSLLNDYYGYYTDEQRNLIGEVGRRLLTFSWDLDTYSKWLTMTSLRSVCRTLSSNLADSECLIRISLQQEHMRLHGIDELFFLANDIEIIIPQNAKLVQDIYKAVFSFNDESEEKTQIGGSRILVLTSTRKQDYQMIKYKLSEHFKGFLEKEPECATAALIDCINSYIGRDHHSTNKEEANSFTFMEENSLIRNDFSHIWNGNDDQTIFADELKMLDIFEKYIHDISQFDDFALRFQKILKVIAKYNYTAAIWRSLLKCGIKSPDRIGSHIISLLYSKPLYICFDTKTALGDFIRAKYRELSEDERKVIENIIITLKDDYDPTLDAKQLTYIERVRDSFLASLPEEYIETEAAQIALQEMKERRLKLNEYTKDSSLSYRKVSVNDYLRRDAKDDIKIPEVKRIDEFNQKANNRKPSLQEIMEIYSILKTVYELLIDNDARIGEKHKDIMWDMLAKACDYILSYGDLSGVDDIRVFAKDVLLLVSQNPYPIYNPDDEEDEKNIFWNGPAPRIYAASGLMFLGFFMKQYDKDIFDAICKLAKDQVAAVRYKIVENLSLLDGLESAKMWDLIDYIIDNEQSMAVIRSLLVGTLVKLANENVEVVAKTTKRVFKRCGNDTGLTSVANACVLIFYRLYIWHDNRDCFDIINELIAKPVLYKDEVKYIIVNTRQILTYGELENDIFGEIRKRAFSIVENIYNVVFMLISKEIDRIRTTEKLPDEEIANLRSMNELIDSISSNLYFASGAYDEEKKQTNSNNKVLTPSEKKRFLVEADSMLNNLANLGTIPSATHHFLQTLESFISIEPILVFEWIGMSINAAQEGGYQYESLAVDLVIKIIERYLAEFRWIFREKRNCLNILFRILDVFVDAGWPSAIRLTFRLEEIFR